MIDLGPVTERMAAVVAGIDDGDLARPTPCEGMLVADLLYHVDGLSQAFTAAARKTPLADPPPIDGSRLDDDWRARIPQRLKELAEAWRAPEAWDGMTAAGGVDLPGEVAGLVALDEVLVHGWDLAVATGQPFEAGEEAVAAAYAFVAPAAADGTGTPGLFGPAVRVPDDAPALDRLLGLTGRDPRWTPPR